MEAEFCKLTGNVLLVPLTKEEADEVYIFFAKNHKYSKDFRMGLTVGEERIGEEPEMPILSFTNEIQS